MTTSFRSSASCGLIGYGWFLIQHFRMQPIFCQNVFPVYTAANFHHAPGGMTVPAEKRSSISLARSGNSAMPCSSQHTKSNVATLHALISVRECSM